MSKNNNHPFENEIHWEDLEVMFNFGSGTFLPKCQMQGVAGLYNMLCHRNYAYLADEVGMGKTAQALALASLIIRQKENARILVIVPRPNLQTNWEKEFKKFVSNFYRLNDGFIKDTFLKGPAFEPLSCSNLRQYAYEVQYSSAPLHLLRLSSFARPVFLTSKDAESMREKYETTINDAGLIRYRARPGGGSDDSYSYNIAFGSSLGAMLRNLKNGPYFDLVIVDEAQYLRNPNQRNDVLEQVVTGNTHRWLFLSATPVHRDRKDIQRLLKDYVQTSMDEWPDHDEDTIFTDYLSKFMIRRNRSVSIPGIGTIGKSDYRHLCSENEDGIPGDGKHVSDLAGLCMVIVQKKLAHLTGTVHGSFKLGLLSSFETLQDTLTDDGDDYYWEDQEKTRGDNKPPDASYVQRISNSFKEEFNLELEHPKLENIARELADIAFKQGEMVLVFCRRINTVKALSARVENIYISKMIDAVEKRWGLKIDFENGILHEQDTELETIDSNSAESDGLYDANDNFLVGTLGKALSEKGWLHRFRRKMTPGGSLELFFEENWLRLIARLAGKTFTEFQQLVNQSSEGLKIAAEAETVRLTSGSFSRRLSLRYLAFQIVDRIGLEVGLSENQRMFLKEGFSKVFGESIYNRRNADQDGKVLPPFVSYMGFWDYWCHYTELDGRASYQNLYLGDMNSVDDFYLRYVRMRWIAAVLRLSPDSILELCACYTTIKHENNDSIIEDMAKKYTEKVVFTSEEDLRGKIIRKSLSAWLSENTRLMAQNCFDEFTDIGDLASKELFTEIRRLKPVVGITAETMDETALKQFNMPCFPLILIATDVLKEGLNLHLNCRRIIHYGVAWTAGDMEQRIGRIDRVDALFERASIKNGLLQIVVKMPFLRRTLEEHQRIQIVKNYKDTQKLLESVGHKGSETDKLIDIEAGARPFQEIELTDPLQNDRSIRRKMTDESGSK